jgi:hypothetical protein
VLEFYIEYHLFKILFEFVQSIAALQRSKLPLGHPLPSFVGRFIDPVSKLG